jgi:hypothetical protein
MASFNYQSIMTPGGLGPALANLGGTLAQAAVDRRRMEAQAADAAAQQEYRQAQLGLEGQRVGLDTQRVGLETQRNVTAEQRAIAEAAQQRRMAETAANAALLQDEARMNAYQLERDKFAWQQANAEAARNAPLSGLESARLDLLRAQADAARAGMPRPGGPSDILRKQAEDAKRFAHEAAKESAAQGARMTGREGLEAEAQFMQQRGFIWDDAVGDYVKPPPPTTRAVPQAAPAQSQVPQVAPMGGISGAIGMAPTPQNAAASEAAALPAYKQIHDTDPQGFVERMRELRAIDPMKYERVKAHIRGNP